MENWGSHLTESYASLVFALLEARGEFELFGALNCVKIVPDMRRVVYSQASRNDKVHQNDQIEVEIPEVQQSKQEKDHKDDGNHDQNCHSDTSRKDENDKQYGRDRKRKAEDRIFLQWHILFEIQVLICVCKDAQKSILIFDCPDVFQVVHPICGNILYSNRLYGLLKAFYLPIVLFFFLDPKNVSILSLALCGSLLVLI